jgi:transposase
MIPIPSGARVWLVTGHTDMRKGYDGLALIVQETITQPPAPFHVTPRGFAGPNLLAMILFEKFGQHQPLNRQSERYAREGVDLSLSTLADADSDEAARLKRDDCAQGFLDDAAPL